MTAEDWRKSTRSPQGNSCVEAMVIWQTSTWSGNGGNCVEVATIEQGVSWV